MSGKADRGRRCRRPLRPNGGRGKALETDRPPERRRTAPGPSEVSWPLLRKRGAKALDLRGDHGLRSDRLTQMRDHQALIKMHHTLLNS